VHHIKEYASNVPLNENLINKIECKHPDSNQYQTTVLRELGTKHMASFELDTT